MIHIQGGKHILKFYSKRQTSQYKESRKAGKGFLTYIDQSLETSWIDFKASMNHFEIVNPILWVFFSDCFGQ